MTRLHYVGVTWVRAILTYSPEPSGAGENAWGLLAPYPAFQPCEVPQAALVKWASGWYFQISKERPADGQSTAAFYSEHYSISQKGKQGYKITLQVSFHLGSMIHPQSG